jgi:hypothetical protein
MKSESESLDPGEACNAWQRKATASPQGGVGSSLTRNLGPQHEVPTSVNPIRPAIPASLLVKGEACGGFVAVRLPRSHPTSKGEGRGVEGGWGRNERKVSWLRSESRAGGRRKPPRGSQSIHSSDEAGNDRGAKGCRKVNAK